MEHTSPESQFREILLQFRASLGPGDRELLDSLIVGALTAPPAPALTGETKWTPLEAEVLLRDIGQLLIDMDGGYRTCGGLCSNPVSRPGDNAIFCTPGCQGEVADGCGCQLYSYPTPKKGDPPPPQKEWRHEELQRVVPDDDRTYKCVCVKKL
jgi:hypothetical protein